MSNEEKMGKIKSIYMMKVFLIGIRVLRRKFKFRMKIKSRLRTNIFGKNILRLF